MKQTIKARVYDVKIISNNLFSIGRTFEDMLKELSSKLDYKDPNNTRILDINVNDKETSIWFDSFDDITRFSQEDIFDNTICFLLAKDMNYQFVENKEKKQIENFSSNEKIKPKIPSHCVFIKDSNILLMEHSSDTPTIFTLHRGIIKNVGYEGLVFEAKYRKDIIERLKLFADNIKSIEIVDLNIEMHLKETEDKDGYLQNFLHNPDTKITAKLQIESNDWRTKAIGFFEQAFNNKITKEIQDIKIKYKDEKQKDEVISLYENLVYLKVEKDSYIEDISSMQQIDRLNYSKEIYKTMIEAYNESKNN